jgi:dipeptidyl aminopeptidase/acylaminoacyl peptidase
MRSSSQFGRGLAVALVVWSVNARAQSATTETGRVFTTADITRIVRLSDPQLSPDGRSIALVTTRANLTDNRWDNDIVLVEVASGAQRTLTNARKRAGTPRWSPSGDRLAFTASVKVGENETPQVFVMPMQGGDARQITQAPGGVQQYAWRPDGREIVYVTEDEPAVKDAHKKGTDAFEISSNDYLTTEAPTPAHIWLTSADSGTPRRLTQGSWSLPISFPPGPPSSPISWSSDGKSIAFTRQQRPYPGETEKTAVQLLDVATGAIRPLTSHTLVEAFPQWSPDGTRIGYLYGRDGDVVNVTDAYLTTPSGGEGANLTRGLDRMFYRILWMPDSKSFIVGANDIDRVSLWQVPVSGTPRKLDLGGISPSNGFWLDLNVGPSGAMTFTGSDATHPAELYYMSSATSAPKRLTSFNTPIAALTLGRADTFDWKGPDNFAENGVVTYPPDFDPNKKYPVILFIHGGPNAASLLTFSAASQAMAGRGYIVFSPNYRGSDNFGNTYYRAVVKNAGDGPGRDVMAGLAVLKQRPYVDSTRIFVTGTSYGGYMTSWLIGHYGGWKAAVAGAAVTDLADQYNFGDGNVGWSYFTGGSPWTEEGEKLTRVQSPITYVRNMKTPTLITSTTGDVRVPVTQSYKLFRALSDLGVETKFIAYPVGGHGPGDPVRLRNWYDRWLAWIEQHDGKLVP